MENINFDDGFKSYIINKDPNRILRFNPCDINILKRLDEGVARINQIAEKNKNIDLNLDGSPISNLQEVVEAVNSVDRAIRDEVDAMLNTSASDVLFGAQSPFCMVNGIQLWERVLTNIIPIVKTEVLKQQKIRAKKIENYTKGVVKK